MTVESPSVCIGCPPVSEEPECVTNPRKVFDFLFKNQFRGPSNDLTDELYENAMNGKMGFHIVMTGCFYCVDIEKWFSMFHEFVLFHKIPFKMSWNTNSSWYGTTFWGAELKDCDNNKQIQPTT